MLNLTKDFLFQRYIIENHTIQEIADETGFTTTKIKSTLRRYGLRKKELNLGDKLYDSKEWLYDQYIVQRKGYTVIANELNVSYTTILDRILFFGWDIRGHSDIDKGAPRRGRKHSSSSIQKIKESRRKNQVVYQCNHCGKQVTKVASAYNKQNSHYCSYTCFKKYLRDHRVETEDITDSAEYKEWRKRVYIRDNYKCKMPGCNSKSKQIAAHHIYPKRLYPEKQFDLSNGITLCKVCHEKTYGKEQHYIDALVRVVQKMND